MPTHLESWTQIDWHSCWLPTEAVLVRIVHSLSGAFSFHKSTIKKKNSRSLTTSLWNIQTETSKSFLEHTVPEAVVAIAVVVVDIVGTVVLNVVAITGSKRYWDLSEFWYHQNFLVEIWNKVNTQNRTCYIYFLKRFITDEIITKPLSMDHDERIIPSPWWWVVVTNQCVPSWFKAACLLYTSPSPRDQRG